MGVGLKFECFIFYDGAGSMSGKPQAYVQDADRTEPLSVAGYSDA